MTAYILISITMLAIAATAKAATPAERLARTVTATHKCQKTIGERPTAFRWRKHSRSYRLWQIRVWQGRLEACRQQNWVSWLPANWVAVARCETGINWAHANSSYVSAFGIQRGSFRGAYDDDAARVGMPPWSDDPKKRTTPWEQYRTALSHYHSFGDGWGCPGP